MKTLKNWVFRHQSADHVELLVDDKHVFRLYVLEPMLARVLIKQHGELKLNRTWSIAPQQDVPWQGRSRESSDGFSLPGFSLEQLDDALRVSTTRMRITIHQPLWLAWEYRDEQGEWQPFAADRPTSAYLLNSHGDGVAHYQRRFPTERYYGLGEKAGDLERTGRRFEVCNLDAMVHNTARTDSLFTHVTFTITRNRHSLA